MKNKLLTIVIPMAGSGIPFKQAGYAFPKPLIDINGKSMIELVVENLKPSVPYQFIFICKKEHYINYSLEEIFERAVGGNNFDVIQLTEPTQGAACTVLTAIDFINSDDDLIIANADQIIDVKLDDFINYSREQKSNGTIMTFKTTHPKWSFARMNNNSIIEIAEKKVISDNATVGIYYFAKGKEFIEAAVSMIEKDIRFNNDFYVSLVYNEIILKGGKVKNWPIAPNEMHSMATPEDLMKYIMYTMVKGIKIVYGKESDE